MAGDQHKYLIDTDVLARIHARSDSQKLYQGVISLAKGGRVKTVRQVFGELKTHGPQYKIISPHRRDFLIDPAEQFSEEVGDWIDYLGDNAFLWEQTGGKNPDPADPWLVAVAKVYGYTVVTNESERSSLKIPAACRLPQIGCRCINGAHFLFEVNIVSEIKPEHISAAAFFDESP